MRAHSERYSAVAIALHWVIAIAILSMIPMGWFMSDLPNSSGLKESLYQMHKSIGITILILTIARIAWRVMNPPPQLPEDMPALEKTASHLVHLGFYALMILLPLSGWLLVSVNFEFQIPTVLFGLISWPHIPFTDGLKNQTGLAVSEFVHSKLAWVAIALLVLHVAGAIKHEITDEEGVLKRMIPGLFGKTDKPAAPTKGAITAFGGAFFAFAVIAAGPMVASAAVNGERARASGEIVANWTVDYERSEIRFSGVHDGNEFSGTFEDWSADIAFDEANLESAAAEVIVQTSSARTGTKLYDDSLDSAEWFNIVEYPGATAYLADFESTEDGYSATLSLTLKDLTVEAPFAFTLTPTESGTVMTGATTLDRTSLNLGQASDPNGDWVSQTVSVDVTVTASPNP